MTIGFNELARRRAVIQKCDATATNDDINNILIASIGMTDSEFDAVVFQARVDAVCKKSYARFEAQEESEVAPVAKSTFDITTDILKAKYAIGGKQ